MKVAIIGLIVSLIFLILALLNFPMPTHNDFAIFVYEIEPSTGYVDGVL